MLGTHPNSLPILHLFQSPTTALNLSALLTLSLFALLALSLTLKYKLARWRLYFTCQQQNPIMILPPTDYSSLQTSVAVSRRLGASSQLTNVKLKAQYMPVFWETFEHLFISGFIYKSQRHKPAKNLAWQCFPFIFNATFQIWGSTIGKYKWEPY